MRILRAWIFRERAVRGPAALELDVAERQIVREQAEVQFAVTEAGRIEHRLTAARSALREALTDATSPGVIDAAETRRLARVLVGAKINAAAHARHLEGLV